MRIIFFELKKILNWKMLFLLLVVNAVLYFFLIDFHIKHFPNGRPSLDSYHIGVQMIGKYGTNMDQSDLADFKMGYNNQIREANRFIQSRNDFKEAGIVSYKDFQNIDMENQKQAAIRDKVFFGESVKMFWELQERERLLEIHNRNKEIFKANMSNANKQQRERLIELQTHGSTNTYPETVFANYLEFIRNVVITIIVSVILITSPVFIQDRLRGIVDLQYTMNTGRSLYKKKLVAGTLAALIVITALLIIYFWIYSFNHTAVFFSLPINNFIGGYYWYDLTFKQFIVLTVIALYVLGIVCAWIAMAFSTFVSHFIALIGFQIPVLFILFVYGLNYLIQNVISISLPQWLLPVSYSLIIAASVSIMISLWKRERNLDIVN